MSVTFPDGFVASGISSGIKKSGKLDLALVAVADRKPVPTAAVFTSNLAAAAPVQVSRRHLVTTAGRAVAVILNSGNANAATGEPGRQVAWGACGLVAGALGVGSSQILVCSTGLIGIPLNLEPFERAVPDLAAALSQSREAGLSAAQAIMTTDTKVKQVAIEADGFKVGAMAKGAAMLAPNMATMLAVMTTDALVDPGELQAILASGVDKSFNRLSVDSATSTNDTVILLASGASKVRAGAGQLEEAITGACSDLAYQMAKDAEGGTKVARIRIIGAASEADARKGARKVAQSLLVKCSIHGEDPYWGRVVSDLGSAQIAFDIDKVSVTYGNVTVCRDGVAIDHDRAAAAEHMSLADIVITADLGLGSADAEMIATDISHAYIDENITTS